MYIHMCVCAKSLQLCLILFYLMDYSLPGSSVHEILQARTLEWVPIPSFPIQGCKLRLLGLLYICTERETELFQGSAKRGFLMV